MNCVRDCPPNEFEAGGLKPEFEFEFRLNPCALLAAVLEFRFTLLPPEFGFPKPPDVLLNSLAAPASTVRLTCCCGNLDSRPPELGWLKPLELPEAELALPNPPELGVKDRA